jgi:hypothetical protein
MIYHGSGGSIGPGFGVRIGSGTGGRGRGFAGFMSLLLNQAHSRSNPTLQFAA